MYEGKIFDAIQFISHKHKDQKRKSFDYPYVTHPLMVFHMVSQYSTDETVHIAALLHDTVEDTDTTLEEVEYKFGKKVRDYVAYLSEDKSLPYRKRKEEYAKGFIGAPHEVLLIKAADILYNLKDSILGVQHYPQDTFTKNICQENWLDSNKDLITTIENEWKENPFIPFLKTTYQELNQVAIEHRTKYCN